MERVGLILLSRPGLLVEEGKTSSGIVRGTWELEECSDSNRDEKCSRSYQQHVVGVC